jgi:VWFA-related protein
MRSTRTLPFVTVALASLVAFPHAQQPAEPPSQDDGFRFKSGVELINVTATVSDASGRFVSNLRREDFTVFEDNQPVQVTHFSAERVPVSLGLVVDTSGSMAGDKMEAARGALSRFLNDLSSQDDEVFLYRFSNFPVLVQNWTVAQRVVAALDRLIPNGGTAMYDAVSEAIPLAQRGQNRKKAIVIISDGNDTASRTDVRELKQQIRESEVLVYAVGIDGDSDGPTIRRTPFPPARPPVPIPFPFPPGRRRFPQIQWPGTGGGSGGYRRMSDDRVNVAALRDMTDDSGGRTEIVRSARDIDPATAGIADELSKQYYLGYPSTGKRDGRWHSIRVEAKNGAYRVRARRGYVAS